MYSHKNHSLYLQVTIEHSWFAYECLRDNMIKLHGRRSTTYCRAGDPRYTVDLCPYSSRCPHMFHSQKFENGRIPTVLTKKALSGNLQKRILTSVLAFSHPRIVPVESLKPTLP